MENKRQKFMKWQIGIVKDTLHVSWTLFKIMIPAIIIVKILEEFGLIKYLSMLLTPLMDLVGLPPSAGLVWATTIFTNLYTGIVVFANLTINESWTVSQATILGTMMLLAHGFPVEGRIAQKAGCRIFSHLMIRFVSALVLGGILNIIYSKANYLQEPLVLSWQPKVEEVSLFQWSLDQLDLCLKILIVIFCLIFILRIFKIIGVEKVLAFLLRPFLKVLGIKPEATAITIVGITLGLSYGGGLMIKEAESGTIDKNDVFASLTFIGLCHSLIEDTMLMMLMGGHLSGIFWGRFIFTFIFVFLLMRLMKKMKEDTIQRYWAFSVSKNQNLIS